jgi:LysM repeat protein
VLARRKVASVAAGGALIAVLAAGCGGGGGGDASSDTTSGGSVRPTVPVTTIPRTTTTAAPQTYTVVKGDSLSKIAARFGVKTADLAAFNGIANPDDIKIGQVLKIPAPGAAGSTTVAASTGGAPTLPGNPTTAPVLGATTTRPAVTATTTKP